jgi:tetratricopeptide (TPR) repeat protein
MAATLPAPVAETPIPSSAPSNRRRTRWRAVVGRWGFRLIVVAVVGANVWWAVRDAWPVPEMKTIQGLIQAGKDRDAEGALRSVLARSPDDGQARLALAKLLGKRGARRDCARELGRIPFWWPGKRDASFYEGEAYRQCNLARAAESAFRLCVTDDPLHPVSPTLLTEASTQLIEIYAFEERWDEAIEVVWNAYRQSSPLEQPTVLGMRIRLMFERMAPESVASRMREYLAADPLDVNARRALARAEVALRRDSEADRQIATCLEADRSNLLVWRDWLKILEFRGDSPRMVEVLAKLPANYQASTDAELWEYIGLARQANNDLAGAAEALRRAVALQPASPTNVYRLARVEQRLGESKLAAEHRRRSNTVRETLGKVTAAYLEYMDLAASKSATTTERRNAAVRLSALFETLGLARDANEWKDIAARS